MTKKATKPKHEPLAQALAHRKGVAEVKNSDELVVYKRHDDNSLTEVYRGGLYDALAELALGPNYASRTRQQVVKQAQVGKEEMVKVRAPRSPTTAKRKTPVKSRS